MLEVSQVLKCKQLHAQGASIRARAERPSQNSSGGPRAGCTRGASVGHAERGQDRRHHPRLDDLRDELAPPAAEPAAQYVDREHPPQQLGPGVATLHAAGHPLGLRRRDVDGPGTIADRQAAAGASTPWYVTWCARGGGISAASFSRNDRASKTTRVVPSDQACRKS